MKAKAGMLAGVVVAVVVAGVLGGDGETPLDGLAVLLTTKR